MAFNRSFDPGRRVTHARAYAERIERQLDRTPVDVVVSADSIASALVSKERRVVLWLDATFDNLLDFYPGFTALTKKALDEGHALERTALEGCALAIYSSSWAAERARAAYGLSAERIATVAWGANLDGERSDQEVAELISARASASCRLVFVGSDWKRKGGPTAVAVAAALNEAGLQTELTVIGCHPKIEPAARSYVRTLGYLDKRHENEMKALEHELGRAHFLLLPTDADCTPLAIAEAASFGLPALATAVGGIPEMVVDGTSGRLFPAGTSPQEYRDAVIELLEDRDCLPPSRRGCPRPVPRTPELADRGGAVRTADS